MKVSPLVAIALFIIITIAIGCALSIWIPGLARTRAVGGQAEAQVKCARSVLQTEIKYKNDQNWMHVSIFYKNGTEALYNFAVTAFGGGKSNTTVITEYTKASPLLPTQSFAKNLTIKPNMIPLDRVIITALCLDLPISVECKSGQPCMKVL